MNQNLSAKNKKTKTTIWYKLTTGIAWLSGLLGRLFNSFCIKLRLCKRKHPEPSKQISVEEKVEKGQKEASSLTPYDKTKRSRQQTKVALLETLLTCENEHLKNVQPKPSLKNELEYMSCVLKKAKAVIATPEDPEPLKVESPQELASTIEKVKEKVASGELTQEEGHVLTIFFKRCNKLLEWAERHKSKPKQD